jgi:hypothetical protein
MQQIGVGHDTVLDARLFAGNNEVVSNVRFGWTERGYDFSDTNAKKVCVQFTKLDACVLERFADVSRIQLEVGQCLVGIGILLKSIRSLAKFLAEDAA